MAVSNESYAAAVARIGELETTLGILAEILGAPTNRFGKLEFHTDKSRAAPFGSRIPSRTVLYSRRAGVKSCFRCSR